MVSQTVLPFKLASTDETLTAQAGLALFGEYCHALGVPAWLDAALPAPGSGAGYAASSHALSVIFMLHGGGRSLEDLRTLRAESGLLALLKLESVPSSDALGDWLRRMGAGAGLAGLACVQRRLLERALTDSDCTAHTLDIDATKVVAEKAATMAWYGQRGEASENRIKELKIGFGQERMPCGQFAANAVFFRLGVLAYNRFKGFTQATLDGPWHRHQIQTLRWRVYQTAGKIVRHAGQQCLKVNRAAVVLFESIRYRCWALAVSGAT